MKRRAHQLSANHGTERPRRIIYLDSESRVSRDGTHTPYLAVARYVTERTDRPRTSDTVVYCDGRSPLSSIAADVSQFADRRERTVLIAHNVEYDLLALGLIPQLVALGWRVADFFSKGLTTILRFRRGEGRSVSSLVCYSSTNIYQTPLAELGTLFGVPKLTVDYNADDLDTMTTYCVRDVDILETAMRAFAAFVETENLGTQAMTVAGQSFNAFRHRFMAHPMFIHDNQTVLQLERDSYIGGRVECFRLGDLSYGVSSVDAERGLDRNGDQWHVCDVNSMYPAVMRDRLYPTKLVGTLFRPSASHLARLIDGGQCVIADVTITTNAPRYGVVIDGKLLFPVGTFAATLTTADVRGAIARGELHDTRYVAVYDAAPVFTAFVDYFYERKANASDPIMRYFYKLILNSCYGKFGQRQSEMVAVGTCAPDECYVIDDCWNAERHAAFSVRAFGGTIFECYDGEAEAMNSFPAVASHVTAYARALLWEGIETAGAANVVYCDTDSLFTNDAGLSRLRDAGMIDGARLGAWDNEKSSTTCVIHGPKDYTFGQVTRLKGVKKGSKPVVKKGARSHDTDTWQVVSWPRLTGSVRAGKIDGFRNVTTRKTMARRYDKGVIESDGRITPFVLTNGGADAILSVRDTT